MKHIFATRWPRWGLLALSLTIGLSPAGCVLSDKPDIPSLEGGDGSPGFGAGGAASASGGTNSGNQGTGGASTGGFGGEGPVGTWGGAPFGGAGGETPR